MDISYYDNFVCDMGDSRESIATDVKENRFYLRIDSKGNYFFSDNSPKTGGDCLGDHFILTEIRNNH